jgi:hypothetical protein
VYVELANIFSPFPGCLFSLFPHCRRFLVSCNPICLFCSCCLCFWGSLQEIIAELTPHSSHTSSPLQSCSHHQGPLPSSSSLQLLSSIPRLTCLTDWQLESLGRRSRLTLIDRGAGAGGTGLTSRTAASGPQPWGDNTASCLIP